MFTAPPRILVVDDEECVRQTLGRWFSRRGFDVDWAADGVEAVCKCRCNTYDAVTLDLDMPRMDGASAFDEIRRSCPRLPVIILTGHDAASFQKSLPASARVLRKPVSMRLLEDEVRAAMGR